LERLRYIREQAGYSQQNLADESGVSQHTISEIELGRRKPQGRTLRKLAGVLNVEVRDFYGESEYPKGEAPPSLQPSFNGLLEDERREATYRAWLEFVNRYAERWERQIESGDFNEYTVNEFIATLEDLGPTLNHLGLQEKRDQPEEYPYSFGPIIGEAIGRLMDLLNPLIEAGVSKFDNSQLEQFRRRRAELDERFAEAG
jgi:transcriptional regulator with XRE-family HTH domain